MANALLSNKHKLLPLTSAWNTVSNDNKFKL